ncbi:MAG: CRISPR-associated protein Csn2-St [Lachnospiraceae bacterium]|nr:CRISPR-associated protein Csn2-St [Lachnospiraceae bacterium]
MKITIRDFEKTLSFNLDHIAQLCGQNIMKKTYICESIRRYFSSFKYSEEKNKWRDNVLFDNENPGRKAYSVISLSNPADMMAVIKLTKQSLMYEFLKSSMQDFQWQKQMEIIENQLAEMFLELNNRIKDFGNIAMTYSVSDVWDMIQKSTVTDTNENDLSELSNYELCTTCLGLLEGVIERMPRKTILILENADHFLTREEYRQVFRKLGQLNYKHGILSIVTLSLDGYLVAERDDLEDVTVFNDTEFSLPSFEYLCDFIEFNYPIQRTMQEDEVLTVIEKCVHNIARENALVSIEENVICKLINNTLQMEEKVACGTESERHFIEL